MIYCTLSLITNVHLKCFICHVSGIGCGGEFLLPNPGATLGPPLALFLKSPMKLILTVSGYSCGELDNVNLTNLLPK